MAAWDLRGAASRTCRCRGCSAAPDDGDRVRASRSASRIRSTSSPRKWRRSWPRATAASRSRSSRDGTSPRSRRSASRFGAIPLMVDANAAYTLGDAEHLAALDRFDLMMIEQPLDYDDVRDHAELQRRIATPICLDESIHSVRAAEEAIALQAPAASSTSSPAGSAGTGESIRLHDLCAAHAIPVWHGGMLESGIGRAHNIHLASLPNFTLPGDIAASRRYFAPDLIEPAIDVSPDGMVAVPTGPGIGVNVGLGSRPGGHARNLRSAHVEEVCGWRLAAGGWGRLAAVGGRRTGNCELSTQTVRLSVRHAIHPVVRSCHCRVALSALCQRAAEAPAAPGSNGGSEDELDAAARRPAHSRRTCTATPPVVTPPPRSRAEMRRRHRLRRSHAGPCGAGRRHRCADPAARGACGRARRVARGRRAASAAARGRRRRGAPDGGVRAGPAAPTRRRCRR